MKKIRFFRHVGGNRRQALALTALTCCLPFLAPWASAQVVISEIMYNPVGGGTNEFVELHNAGTGAVDVGGWFFSDGITYTFPTPSVMGADAYLVVAVNRPAFTALYPDVTNLAAGVYAGQLSNQGEKLALADAASTPVFSVTYNNKEPWPLAAAGLGSSLVLVDPYTPADNPSNWVASAQLNGSPGGPDRFFVRDVVINEVLAHTDPPQEDAVELLERYHWPGNIRELAHAVERAVILNKTGMLKSEDFVLKIKPQLIPVLDEQIFRVEDFERKAIANALNKNNGNLSKAANDLGVARTTLYRKISHFGLEFWK